MKNSVIKNTNMKTREPDVQATERISQIVEDHASSGLSSVWFFVLKANGSPPVGSATATRQKDQPVTMQRYALNGGAPAR